MKVNAIVDLPLNIGPLKWAFGRYRTTNLQEPESKQVPNASLTGRFP